MPRDGQLQSVLEVEAAILIMVFRAISLGGILFSVALILNAIYFNGYGLAVVHSVVLLFFIYSWRYDFEEHKAKKKAEFED